MSSLRLKSMMVGSPLEGLATTAKRFLETRERNARPEVAELLLEGKRVPQILSRLLSRSSNVLDIGGHIGSFISVASRLAPKGCHAIIEASPTKAASLKKKFPAMEVLQKAVSDYIGLAAFEENLTRAGFSRLADGRKSVDAVSHYEVEITTLDALNFNQRFDFVKIDIEGAELAAFRGGKRFFAETRPNVMFECGAEGIEGLDRAALFAYLTEQMGYDVFSFTDFLFNKGPLGADEFRKCGVYPFRAFNYLALPKR